MLLVCDYLQFKISLINSITRSAIAPADVSAGDSIPINCTTFANCGSRAIMKSVA